MKPEVTIKEIQAAIKSTGQNAANIHARVTKEKWTCRVCGNERHYITVLLPGDVQLALKANTLPAIKEDKLPTLGIRKDSRTYRIQEEKAFAKAELAKAYVTHMDQAGHGQKKKLRRWFLENYNLGEPGLFPAVYRIVGKVDLNGKTVEGWVNKLKKNNWEPMSLVDMRGFSKRGKRSLTPEHMNIILAIVRSPYNTPGKPVLEIIHQAKSIMQRSYA